MLQPLQLFFFLQFPQSMFAAQFAVTNDFTLNRKRTIRPRNHLEW